MKKSKDADTVEMLKNLKEKAVEIFEPDRNNKPKKNETDYYLLNIEKGTRTKGFLKLKNRSNKWKIKRTGSKIQIKTT
tara:strand:+ start:452 stop:685 length:234 start_codon:yes stop_codon:yes gene_type:complete